MNGDPEWLYWAAMVFMCVVGYVLGLFDES